MRKKRYGNEFYERRNRFHSTFSLLFRAPSIHRRVTLTGSTISHPNDNNNNNNNGQKWVCRVRNEKVYISINSAAVIRGSRFSKKIIFIIFGSGEGERKEERRIMIIKKRIRNEPNNEAEKRKITIEFFGLIIAEQTHHCHAIVPSDSRSANDFRIRIGNVRIWPFAWNEMHPKMDLRTQ